MHPFFKDRGASLRAAGGARTFRELADDGIRRGGTSELRQTAAADSLDDVGHLQRAFEGEGISQHLAVDDFLLLQETNNWGRGGRGARGDERCASARAYRQASRPRVLQNLVTRVLDRALLERAGALAFADLFAHLSTLDRPWYGSHPGWESRRTNRKCTLCPRKARAENSLTAAETPFHAPSVSRSARRGAFPRVDGCARARSRPAS